MDTHDRKVIDILSDQKRFIVPFYQRQYKWGEKLWISFWEDVLAKAVESLERSPKFDHYMGALILSPESYSVAVTPRLMIVDGQQRLTTFQLFLTAIREVGNTLGHPEIGEAVHDYLFNRPMSGDVGDDVKFKLAPNRADRATFYTLVDKGLDAVRVENPNWFFQNGRVIKKHAPNAVCAVCFFEQRILQFAKAGYIEEREAEDDALPEQADDEPNLSSRRLQALMTALLNHLKLVVIMLDESDDAQVIFETLNSKNEPLTAMELVRNNIFQRAAAESETAERLFETKWQPLEKPFWQQIAPRARPRRPRIDHFLSHALTAQTGDEISLRELYAEYRAFARPKGTPRFATLEAELDALLRFASVYQALEGQGEDADLAWLGDKLMLWEVSTAYPVAFAIAVADVAPQVKRAIYELLNSYLVRRAICGLTPKNLNKNFQRMVAALLRDGVSVDTFVGTFRGQKGDSVRFPSNDEFREAIRSQPVYERFHRKGRLCEILWDLECAMRDKFTVNAPRPDFLSIEHIMPQSWATHWPLPSGQQVDELDVLLGASHDDEQTRKEVLTRQRLIHTLGNLTLVTVPANSAASNAAFGQKRTWLGKSLLAMNSEIIEGASWSEEEILARGTALGEVIVQVWPAPAQL